MVASPGCKITSSNSTDTGQKMIDYETIDQKMSPPLLESDTSSLHADTPLASPTSTPSFTTWKALRENEENIPPKTTGVSTTVPTMTHTNQITVVDDALPQVLTASAEQQAQLPIERQQAQFRALGPIHRVKLGHEFDYVVNRKRELRVKKMHGHKNSMSPDLQQALADAAQKRAKEEVMMKKKAKEEKHKAWELELELFGDGGDMFRDDVKPN